MRCIASRGTASSPRTWDGGVRGAHRCLAKHCRWAAGEVRREPEGNMGEGKRRITFPGYCCCCNSISSAQEAAACWPWCTIHSLPPLVHILDTGLCLLGQSFLGDRGIFSQIHTNGQSLDWMLFSSQHEILTNWVTHWKFGQIGFNHNGNRI